jgi:hypothetical protein
METDQLLAARTLRCVHCGAENVRDAPRCWSCTKEDWREDDEDFGPPYPVRFAVLRGFVVFFCLLALAFLLRFRSPIAAIILLCIVVPAFVIGEVQSLRCKRWGVPLSARDRLLTAFKCAIVLTPLLIFLTLTALVIFGAVRVGAAWSSWLELP